MPRTRPPGATTERTAERTARGKVWNRADGKRVIECDTQLRHWSDGGVLREVDMTPRRVGDEWQSDGAFEAVVLNSGPGYIYTSKRGRGSLTATLQGVSGTPVINADDPLRVKYLWVEAFTDVDVEIQVRSGGLYSYTRIKSPAAQHEFTWQVAATGDLEFRAPIVESHDALTLPLNVERVVRGRNHVITVNVQSPDLYPLELR